MHAVGIHDPAHHLGIGIHIRGGDIRIGADEHDDLRGIAPRHPLELPFGHRLGVAFDTTLGTTKGNVDEGTLPCHEHGQSANLLEANRWMESNSSLGRSPGDIVLNTKSGKYLVLPVIHLDGKVDGDLPFNDC